MDTDGYAMVISIDGTARLNVLRTASSTASIEENLMALRTSGHIPCSRYRWLGIALQSGGRRRRRLLRRELLRTGVRGAGLKKEAAISETSCVLPCFEAAVSVQGFRRNAPELPRPTGWPAGKPARIGPSRGTHTGNGFGSSLHEGFHRFRVASSSMRR